MDALILAKELGEAIANSKEMNELKEADARLQDDQMGTALMNEYKQMQIELVRASREKRDNETLDEIKEMLIKKQQQMNDYEITGRYLETKSAFDKFMKNINDIITFAITGETPCAPDKCGSCGGCK